MRFLNAFAGLSLLLASAATSTVSAQCPPDTEAPVITNMPANILQTAEPGICGATISWTIPTATDNCEVTSFSADQVPDDFYSVGITTVTYTAMDAEGNMSAASFTITITDDEDPSISDMPADISANNDTGNCSSIVTWDAPSADDNCGISTLTSDHDSGDAFPVGTTTVTYTATDVNGNSITDSFDITVTDNEAPSAAASDLTLVLDASGAASTTAAAVNNGSSDNCNIASIDLSQTDFDCTHLGNNTVTLTVTDIHSNQSTATATITVQDNQAPAIAQMADISATNDANNCSAVVTWTDPAVTDNCTYTLTTDIASGATFNVGVTTVTYSVTDAGGNTDAMSFDVTVTDTQAPTISGMPAADIIQGTDAGVCTAAVTWSAPTATDNCTTDAVGNPANVMLTSTHQPGSDFAIGTTTVTYTAIDIYGNTSTATFDVIVTSTDTDGDGICDTGDNCSDTEACNY
ncbi:MAG: HYR domain-containing protein, partial [Bacteroidota bacterium]|nr:HYR domain-containing protein [Bacteroidota bacterium]